MSEWLLAAASRNGSSELSRQQQLSAAESSLSHAAREVLAGLEQRGASFFAELVRGTGRLASEVEDGLWELVAAGPGDCRRLRKPPLAGGPQAAPRRGTGTTGAPQARRGPLGAASVRRRSRASRSLRPGWKPSARQLLRRWGVVFRDLMARETLAPPWRDLLVTLRRMEARGEIRGGRFVAGLAGEQFARPEAIELLRAVRRAEEPGEEVELSVADPLNLAGIILPGQRISALWRAARYTCETACRLHPSRPPLCFP